MSKRQLFGISLLLFVLHQILQKGFGIHLFFLHAYLDPFLAMPLILGILDWERRWRYGAAPLRGWEIAVVAIGVSLLFECGFPRWNPRTTADAYDVLAYGLGAAIYGMAGDHSSRTADRKQD